MPNVTNETSYHSAMLPFKQYFQSLEDNKHMISELKVQLEKLKEKEMEEELNQLDIEVEDEENADKNKSPDNEVNETDKEDSSPVNDGNEDVKSDDTKKDQNIAKEPKSLLQTGPGYGTLYKTLGKET